MRRPKPAISWVARAAVAFGTLVCPSAAATPTPHQRACYQRAAEPASAAAAISELVGSMERAVSAPSREGYLDLLAAGDAVFLTEQRAWIDDVVERPPEAFDLAIDSGSIEPAPDGASATGELTATWRMPDGPERSVTFPARFVERANGGGWAYAGRAWKTVTGEHVAFKHAAGLRPVARDLAEAFPGIADHVETGFQLERGEDFPAGRVQQIKLYDSMAELQYSIYPSYTEPLGGWNEPGESIKLLVRGGASARSLRKPLAHEYAHVTTFLLGPHATDAPWWVLEGVAELASARYGRSWEQIKGTVAMWAEQDRLADWSELADFRGIDPAMTMHVYLQGHAMLAYISERYGRTERNGWLAAMAQGQSLEAATKEVLGLPFEALDAAWRAWVEPRPDAEDGPKAEPAEDNGRDGAQGRNAPEPDSKSGAAPDARPVPPASSEPARAPEG